MEASPERGCLAEESGGKKNEQDRDQVEKVIEQEVGEYVITNELKKHFITFFSFYADALNVPTGDISLFFLAQKIRQTSSFYRSTFVEMVLRNIF